MYRLATSSIRCNQLVSWIRDTLKSCTVRSVRNFPRFNALEWRIGASSTSKSSRQGSGLCITRRSLPMCWPLRCDGAADVERNWKEETSARLVDAFFFFLTNGSDVMCFLLVPGFALAGIRHAVVIIVIIIVAISANDQTENNNLPSCNVICFFWVWTYWAKRVSSFLLFLSFNCFSCESWARWNDDSRSCELADRPDLQPFKRRVISWKLLHDYKEKKGTSMFSWEFTIQFVIVLLFSIAEWCNLSLNSWTFKKVDRYCR